MDEDKRRFKRFKCEISAEFAMYSNKSRNGKGTIKNASLGGICLAVKAKPEVETVMALKVEEKHLSRYVDYDRIILDPDNNPLIRVVHLAKDPKVNRQYAVGARFMVRPGQRTEYD